MELYIIRHAQSQNNEIWARTGTEEGRFPDPELTEIGRKQAELVAKRVAVVDTAVLENKADPHNRNGYNLTHLYASLQTRAVQTGTAISQATGLPLVAWEEIHEWGGIYDSDFENDIYTGLPGPNRTYFEQRFPDFILPPSLGEEGWWNRPHEERPTTVERAKSFYAQLLERHDETDDRVGMVSHGGFITIFLMLLNDAYDENNQLKQSKYVWYLHNNTAVTRVDFNKEFYRFGYQNDVNHLPSELIT